MDPAAYYRGIITYVGDPQPQSLEQTMIELLPTGGFVGQIIFCCGKWEQI